MDNLYIEGTSTTPEVYFNISKNIFKIEGQSYPENAFKFYQPIVEYIEKHLADFTGRVIFEFSFHYLNTSSTKCLMNIMDVLEDAYEMGKEPVLNWYYDDNNKDMFETAQEFKEDIRFNFNIISLTNKLKIPLEFKTENDIMDNIEYITHKYKSDNSDSNLFKEYVSLGKSYRKLLRQVVKLTHISDRQQEHLIKTTKDLEETTTSLSSLLDHAGQGFLSFSNDLIIDKNYSVECEKIFSCIPSGQNFVELVFKNLEDEKTTIERSLINIIKSIENNHQLGINVYMSLLPQFTIIEDKHIKLEYKILEKPKKIMAILTDISEKIKFQNKVKEEERILRVTVDIIANQSAIKELFQSYRNFFNKYIEKTNFTKEELQEFYRTIHTFKGSFAQHYLDFTSNALHQLESDLHFVIRNFENTSFEKIKDIINKFPYLETFKQDLLESEKLLGENFFNLEDKSRPILIDKIEIEMLKEMIKPGMSSEELIALKNSLDKLTYISLKETLKSFSNYIYSQAETFEKEIKEFIITGNDVKIESMKFQPIIDLLGHLFRNSIIHGIEPSYERIVKGKEPEGVISCNINTFNNSLILSIKDDGQGILSETIKNNLLKNNLFSCKEIEKMSRKEIVDCIFIQNFSTSPYVTDIAGRGIGLTEVKEKINNFGGSIEVISEEEQGTEFKIILPI